MKSYTYQEPEKPRGPALFSGRKLAGQQSGLERFVAILLLLLSLAGSVLAGGGGVEAWAALRPLWWGALAALALQGVLSYVQWVYCTRWASWQYLSAVAVSSALTLIGFWPLAHPWLVGVLEWARVPAAMAPNYAGALLIVVALGIDLFPERTLVAR
jgi:hypothetical protein